MYTLEQIVDAAKRGLSAQAYCQGHGVRTGALFFEDSDLCGWSIELCGDDVNWTIASEAIGIWHDHSDLVIFGLNGEPQSVHHLRQRLTTIY